MRQAKKYASSFSFRMKITNFPKGEITLGLETVYQRKEELTLLTLLQY
jgi:hypothetical protein